MRLTCLLILFCITIILAGCGSPEDRAAAYLESAQELFDQADYDKAKLEARNAVQIEPKNVAARYLLAQIAGQEQKFRAMLGHLLVVVDEAPDMVEARVKLGSLYFLGREYKLASEQAVAAMALAPGDIDVQILNAQLLLQRDELERGLAVLNSVLSRDPDHLIALGMKAMTFQESDPDRALGFLDEAIGRFAVNKALPLRQLKLEILTRQGRTEELEQALLAIIADTDDIEDVDNSVYRAQLARFYRNQGSMDKAEDMLRDLAADVRDDIGPRLDVVRFLSDVNKPEAAAEALQVFIEEDPENLLLKRALGDFYMATDQRAAAVSIYEEIAALEPLSEQGLQARFRLAAELVWNGDMEGAEEMVAAMLVDAPAYAPALLIRAGLFFIEERYEEAIADLRLVLRKEGDNQRALLLMARSYDAAGENILSKDAYRRLLVINPGHAAATGELIPLMVQDNEFEEAEVFLGQLIKNASGNTTAGVLMIELLVRQDDWQGAEAVARRMATGTDLNGIGAYHLGQVLEGQQRYKEAAEAFLQALEKSPYNISMLQGLARTWNVQGKEDQMIIYLRQRVIEKPDNTGIRLMLGGALADQGHRAEAQQLFEQVIADQPERSPAYMALGSLYPDDATKRIAIYRRGLAASPASLVLGSSLAIEYQQLGQVDELIEIYEQLLAAHPENLELVNNLAAVLVEQRYQDPASIERAVKLVERLVDTDDAGIMDTVGWVYYRVGDNDRAVRYLERAVAAIGEIPVVHYHLGMAYLAAGNRLGAKQELEIATASTAANYTGIEEARKTLATL